MLQLQATVGNRATARILQRAAARRRASPERARSPRALSAVVQRAMKFEFQTRNRILRNHGGTATPLGRKFGPKDFLVEGSNGARLESETNGVLEFETGWHRTSTRLLAAIQEAVDMTNQMNGAPSLASGRKAFPFPTPHLRTGTAKERQRGRWRRRRGKEGANERILRRGETLEVEMRDSTWNAGIQSSEGFELRQYESFLKQHEFKDYREPVIVGADALLAKVNTAGHPASSLVNLRNFLMIVVNYVKRGQGGPASDAAGAFADVAGTPSKQAFTLMSRTAFDSMFADLLSPLEQRLFRKLVADRTILTDMGLTTRSPFFIKGYGTHTRKGPTVHQWLRGITRGYDLLSVQHTKSMSAAQGRHDVEKRPGKKDTGLVKFETRNRPTSAGGAFRTADKWLEYVIGLFATAMVFRRRAKGKGKTGLKL